MPTYEYLCQACSHRFETMQRMADEPLTNCPECNGHIRRVFFPAGVVFKGQGFYKTDHGSGSVGHPNGKDQAREEQTAPKDGETKASAASSESTPSTNGASSDAGPASSGDNKQPASTGTK